MAVTGSVSRSVAVGLVSVAAALLGANPPAFAAASGPSRRPGPVSTCRPSSLFDNAPMPYSVFYNGGEAFHQGDIAIRSHGCVRLTRDAAQTFYDTLHPGDVVQVVG